MEAILKSYKKYLKKILFTIPFNNLGGKLKITFMTRSELFSSPYLAGMSMSLITALIIFKLISISDSKKYRLLIFSNLSFCRARLWIAVKPFVGSIIFQYPEAAFTKKDSRLLIFILIWQTGLLMKIFKIPVWSWLKWNMDIKLN